MRPVRNTVDASAKVGVHYLLSCYICGPTCVKPSPFESWVTFTQIVQARPDTCRFAIAQLVPVLSTGPLEEFVAFDLFDDAVVLARGSWVWAPEPIWRGPSEDGLIVKAMTLFDKESER